MRLDGKVAVVTGGASGIGEASSIALAEAGARVVVADVNEELGQNVAAAIREKHGEAQFFAVNVTDENAVAAMVAFAEERYGGLDCAVNSAGAGAPPQPLIDTPTEVWRRVWELCMLGVAFSMRYEAAAILRRGKGSIVNIASDSGLYGTAQLGPYCSAKHGVVGATKCAALEFGPKNLRVNAICPGVIDTPAMKRAAASGINWNEVVPNPMGRMGQPHEIADACLWLVSDRSSFVNGQAISIDGGLYAG
jgi:NAD(P)-dependent dehydrogenase (short-subunit alcohol dehydrogenase family)